MPHLACLAVRLARSCAWVDAGYARCEDFARERVGRSGRWLRDLAALGGCLEAFPALEDAITGADGGKPLGSVASLAIARHVQAADATRDESTTDAQRSVAQWIAHARRCTVRELRKALREDSCNDGTRPSATGAEDDVHVRVRIHVPLEVRDAFEEVRELHEALNGGRTSAGAFVEALHAEIAASGVSGSGDTHLAPASVAAKRRKREAMLDQARRPATEIDETQGTPAAGAGRFGPVARSPATRRAIALLRRLDAVCDQGNTEWDAESPEAMSSEDDPAALLRRFERQVELEEAAERCVGELLAELEDLVPWPALGFADLEHYAEASLGMSRSSARERATLARRLRRLPEVRKAYETGDLRLVAAKIVARAVEARAGGDRGTRVDPTPQARQRAWVAAASQRTVKRLRDELRVVRRRSRFGRPDAREPLDDATWFASLAHAPGQTRDHVLRAGFTLVGRVQRGEAKQAPITADAALRLHLPEASARDLVAGIEACRRALEAQSRRAGSDAAADPSAEARQLPSLRLAHTFSTRGLRVPEWLGLLAWIEEVALVWDDPATMPRRAAQAVYVRDGWRCAAPGCTSRRNLENHHVEYRSRGGGDGLDNRITLCRFHHQWGEHGGRMRVRGTAPLGLHWSLGRGALAVSYRNERRVE